MPDETKKNGVDNLIPFNERTEDEQRAIRAMGGKASGEARRRKKKFKTILSEIITMPVKNEKMRGNLKLLGLDPDEANLQISIAAAMVIAAANGNVKAYTAIRDTMGETPKAKVEVDGDMSVQTVEAIDAYNAAAAAIKKVGFGDSTPK